MRKKVTYTIVVFMLICIITLGFFAVDPAGDTLLAPSHLLPYPFFWFFFHSAQDHGQLLSSRTASLYSGMPLKVLMKKTTRQWYLKE